MRNGIRSTEVASSHPSAAPVLDRLKREYRVSAEKDLRHRAVAAAFLHGGKAEFAELLAVVEA